VFCAAAEKRRLSGRRFLFDRDTNRSALTASAVNQETTVLQFFIDSRSPNRNRRKIKVPIDALRSQARKDLAFSGVEDHFPASPGEHKTIFVESFRGRRD
jgi:hypothetical protein